MIANRSILVRLGDSPQRISVGEERVHFAFPSGRWMYDCRECNAICCRGHGYALNAGIELRSHIEHSPSVRLFLRSHGKEGHASSFSSRNLAPACFMLTQDGLCDVHVKYGFRAKPETCRLFPFNQFRFFEGYLIVEPHRSLCPLRVSTASHQLSDHSALIGVLEDGGIEAPVTRVQSLGNPGAAIELERRILALTEAHLVSPSGSYEPHVAAQINASIDLLDGPAGGDGQVTISALGRFNANLQSILMDWPSEPAAKAVSQLMVAATPSLRARLVFPKTDADQRSVVPLERVPHLLLALHKLVALAVDAGMRDLTYQTVSTMLDTYRPLLKLAAHADCRMRWAQSAKLDFSVGADDSVASYTYYIRAAKLLAQSPGSVPPLGEVISASIGPELIGRLDRVNRLAGRLVGRLEPVREPRHRRRSLKRWVLVQAPESVFVTIAGRKISRRPA